MNALESASSAPSMRAIRIPQIVEHRDYGKSKGCIIESNFTFTAAVLITAVRKALTLIVAYFNSYKYIN